MTLSISPVDPDFFRLLTESFERLVSSALPSSHLGPAWLYEHAPFAVLAHDTDADPRFIYANRAAQRCFEYAWDELIGMPSRLSAEAPNRAERQRLLDEVSLNGYVSGYRGVRIAKSGRRFWIEDGVVWQLVDANGVHRGQAAMFSAWRDVDR
jgi:PAS domain S-box-containing protein